MSRGQLRPEYPVTGPDFSYAVAAVSGADSSLRVTLGDQVVELSITPTGSGEGRCRAASGRSHQFMYAWVDRQLQLWLDGYLFIFQRVERQRRGGPPTGDRGNLVIAPMPGTVIQVMVRAGDRVERDQPLLVLESMKMELVIGAPRDGVVREVPVAEGSPVEQGARLLELEEEISS